LRRATRRESVLNGLVACASAVDPNDWILVHDAARPCLGRLELRRLIDSAGGDEVGGILAIPVSDTLKRADNEGRILETEPRDHLWQAQTPQMFRHGMLCARCARQRTSPTRRRRSRPWPQTKAVEAARAI